MAGFYNYGYPYAGQQMNVPQYTQAAQQTGQMQIQNGGFVSVRSEDEARMYPVAPGNSVTFKDENAPFVYTKTMGFSQLDMPIFEKYRLVKEEPQKQQSAPKEPENFALKSDLEVLVTAYNELKQEINHLKTSLGEDTGELKDESAV